MINARWTPPTKLRETIAAEHLYPYDLLDTSPRNVGQAFLEDLIANGWRTGGVRAGITPPANFDQLDRSSSFHAHALEPLTFLLPGFEKFGDGRYLETSIVYALDWLSRYQLDLLEMEDADAALAAAAKHRETQAWYDMGVAQRLYRLAYIADVVAREGTVSDHVFETLFSAILFHQELLAQDGFFVSTTNHGLYQALGQLAASRRFLFVPGFSAYRDIAMERLRSMVARSFMPSGVHNEHSTGYHFMILGSLLGARESGLLDEDINGLLGRAEEALSWMYSPDGSLVPIGDTDLNVRPITTVLDYYRHPSLAYVRSNGEIGERPKTNLQVYRDAGYVFARKGDTPREGSYLAQAAGFHSKTHKHADHLSFVWFENGREILIDPGRYSYASAKPEPGSALAEAGFWYSDPRRVYVEKTRAHNCVEIDGKDYPRRAAKLFGSALVCAEDCNGLIVTSCEATHFRYVRHWRGLIYAPGHFLIVVDRLHDRTAEHHYRQWFQVAGDLPIERHGDAISIGGSHPVQVVSFDGAAVGDIATGRVEPELQGWRSDAANSLIPSHSFCFMRSGNSTIFATGFVLTDHVEEASMSVNAAAKQGIFRWKAGRAIHSVSFTRDDESISANASSRLCEEK